MKMETRSWEAPRLIVLARREAEEAVLAGCKGGPGHTSFLVHHDACHANEPACTTLCSSIGAS